MPWKAKIIAAPALALAALLAIPAAGIATPAHAACEPGDRINGSTADWAAGKAKEAGYIDIRMERKGCDNYWHGIGTKGGQPARFVVAPDGQVMPEGD